MNWVVIIIGILLSIVAVFLSNLIFIFSIHPILLILFIIVAIIGIISYKEYDNVFEFGPLFGIGFAVSFIALILLEIFAWNGVIIPVIRRSVPFFAEQIIASSQSDPISKVLIAILITVEEPIIIGLLFPLIFEGIIYISRFIIGFVEGIRQQNFKNKYLHICLNFVLNSAKPVYENDIVDIIPCGSEKYRLKDTLLYELKQRTYFDSEKKLYWGAESFNKMKKNIENILLNTSPKPLEWLIDNIPEYKSSEYIAFKVTAIRELAKERIFVLETTTGGTLNSESEETALYRHRNGSKINTVVYEDDPDFY